MSNDAPQLSLIGQQIAHYRITGQLGAGGMGVVYKALDTRLDRHVALKFLPPHLSEDPRRKARFLQEAKTAAALDHVNVGTLYGIEETNQGQMFLVMACYDGRPLNDLLRHAALPLAKSLNIAQQIGRGLAAAHRQGVIHRDIKPSNVLVTSDGVVKIVDFGLARFTHAEHLTEAGATAGTAAYMSPEQVKGEDVDHRTDLWSLGVVLCEMLTGQLPFRGENTHSLLYKVVHEPPALSPAIPAQSSGILSKALAKNREERYAKAEDLVADLEAMQAGLPVAENTQTVTSHWSPSASALRSQPPKIEPRQPLLTAARLRWGVPTALLMALVAIVPSWRTWTMQWLTPGPASTAKHIVVLPFKNIGNDPANAALCEGLTEVLTGRLTGLEQGVPTLWVIPSSEVRRRKVSSESEAQKEFGATLAISGSVEKTATGVRLALNLVDAKTLRVLGSRLVQSPTGDLAATEDEAVRNIAELLAVHIDPKMVRQPISSATAHPAAYESYLRATGLLRRSDKSDNVEAAIQELNSSIQADPKFALAYSGLATAFFSKWTSTKDSKWLDATVDNAKRALALDGQLAPALVALGQAHEASRNPELAVSELQQALKLDPRNTTALRSLARMWERLGRTSDAENLFQNAISLHPDYWEGHTSYGVFLQRQGRKAAAEQELRRSLELAPDNATTYSNLGALLLDVDRAKEAREMFLKSISIAPSYFALANLATLLSDQGQDTEAARTYEHALKMNDKDYRVWAYLATQYRSLHDTRAKPTLERATEMAEAALAREGQSPTVIADLSYYYAKLGRTAKAVEFAKQATLLASKDSKILRRTALTFEICGLRQESLKNVEAAIHNGLPAVKIGADPEFQSLIHDPRYAGIASDKQKKDSADK